MTTERSSAAKPRAKRRTTKVTSQPTDSVPDLAELPVMVGSKRKRRELPGAVQLAIPLDAPEPPTS